MKFDMVEFRAVDALLLNNGDRAAIAEMIRKKCIENEAKYSELVYQLENCKYFFFGQWWMQLSLDEWVETFPWMSNATIGRNLKFLIEANLIVRQPTNTDVPHARGRAPSFYRPTTDIERGVL